MNGTLKSLAAALSIAAGAIVVQALAADAPPKPPMTFFLTSVGMGKGGDLGGIAGADKHCQTLAAAAGVGDRTWRAYLSTQGAGAINARDRIGQGPWHNFKGQIVAADLADLHGDTLELARKGNLINKRTVFDERGNPVKGSTDTPNEHDVLTGTQLDGTAYTDAADHTCKNWTSSSPNDTAQIGHHDRNSASSISWNSAHATRGCHQDGIVSTGGAGQLYCFAVK
jgi:hypothetical protein